MNDLRVDPTPEPRSLEDRLRHDGAAYQGLREGWVPDLADVTVRSRRQHRRSRQALAVAAVFVAVLGAGGLGLRAARSSGDQELHLGGSGTTVPTTPEPPASVPSSVPTTPPTTAAAPAPTSALPVTSTTGPPITATPAPSTTVPTTPVGPAVTTSVVTPATNVELRADGLGIVSFGDAEADVMARLTAALGAPTVDSGWSQANTGMEGRPNRYVMWGGFSVAFLENASGRYLAAWRISAVNDDVGIERTPALATPDGLRLGLRYEDIQGRLGGAVPVAGEGATGYRVATAAGPLYVWFDPPVYSFTQPPGPDATIAALDAGDPMSAHEP
jgi:hypothetical protein